MSKHTPGPWGYRGSLGPQSNPHLKGPHIVEADNGTQIAIMSGWRSDCSEANARLIAAAPEMLAALIALRDEYKQAVAGLHMQSSRQLAWTNADAVIAKATGEKL